MQQLGLGAGIKQEGVAAEGEGPICAKLVLGRVMRLAPGHVVVLHIQLLAAINPDTGVLICALKCVDAGQCVAVSGGAIVLSLAADRTSSRDALDSRCAAAMSKMSELTQELF